MTHFQDRVTAQGSNENDGQVIAGTPFDRRQYLRAVGMAGQVPGSTTARLLPNWPNLAEDVFRICFQPQVEMRLVPPALAPARLLLEQALGLPEIAGDLHAETQNDALASYVAAETLLARLWDQLSGEPEVAPLCEQLAAAQREEAEQREKQAQSEMDALESRAAAQESDLSPEQAEVADEQREQAERAEDAAAEAEARADAAGAQAEEVAEQLTARLEEMIGGVRQDLRAAAAAAQIESELVSDGVSLLSGDEHGAEGDNLPTDAQRAFGFAQRLKGDRRLRVVFRVLGRLVQINRQVQQATVSGVQGTLHGHEKGREISRMTGISRAQFASARLRPGWKLAFADGQLEQHRTKGKTNAGCGPVCVVVDRSGSMTVPVERSYAGVDVRENPTRAEWASGVALALLRQAQQDKRDVLLVDFADGARAQGYPRGTHGWDEALDVLSNRRGAGLGSGTNFGAWMQMVRTQLVGGLAKADVLLVTDVLDARECFVEPAVLAEWQVWRRAKEVRVFAVVIGKDSPRAATYVTEQIADGVLYLDDAADEAAALTELFTRARPRG
jgi:uncharacterized protein with von Willebrand factor type A (vWA) domain